MAKTVKRNLFTFLGWLIWTLLAKIGVPAAKRRMQDKRSQRRDRA